MPPPPSKKSCWVCLQPVDEKVDSCAICNQPTVAPCLQHGGRVKLYHEVKKIREQVRGNVPNKEKPDYLLCPQCGFDSLVSRSHLGVAESIAVKLLKDDQSDQASRLAKEIKEARKQAIPAFEKAQQEIAVLERIPLLLGQKKYSEAIRQYESILSLDPNYTKAKQGILETKDAWCLSLLEEITGLLGKNDFTGAQTQFNQAKKLGSRKTTELIKAQKQIEDAAAKHFITQAVSFQERREFDKAKQSYEKATQAAPNFREATAALKKFSEWLDKNTRLETEFKRAISEIHLNSALKLLGQIEAHDPGNGCLKQIAKINQRIAQYDQDLDSLRNSMKAQDKSPSLISREGEIKLLNLWGQNKADLEKFDFPDRNIVVPRMELADERLRSSQEIDTAIKSGEDRELVGLWGKHASILNSFEPHISIGPTIEQAELRVLAVDSIRKSATNGDEEAIINTWNQCSDFHEATIFDLEQADNLSIRKRFEKAKDIIEATQKVLQTIAQQDANSTTGELKKWVLESEIISIQQKTSSTTIDSVYYSDNIGDRVRNAQKLVDAFTELRSACTTSEDRKALSIWKEHGGELRSYEHIQTLGGALKDAETRQSAVDNIIKAAKTNDEAQISLLWDQCPLLHGSTIAVQDKVDNLNIRDRCQLAKERVNAVKGIEGKSQTQEQLSNSRKPITWENESIICSIAETHSKALNGSTYYDSRVSKRVNKAKKIVESYEKFSAVCGENNGVKIRDFWVKHSEIHNLDLIQQLKQQIISICKAVGGLERFEKLYSEAPHADEKLIKTWEQTIKNEISSLADQPALSLGNKPPSKIIADCRKRLEIKRVVFGELIKSAADRDYLKILKFWNPVLCKKHPEFSERLDSIQSAVQRGNWLEKIIKALNNRNGEEVIEIWEKHAEWMAPVIILQPYLPGVRQWVIDMARRGRKMIKKSPLSTISEDTSGLKINWEWPHDGPDECLVALKSGSWPMRPHASSPIIPEQHVQTLSFNQFNQIGCRFNGKHPDPHVSIWPLTTFCGEKIILDLGDDGKPVLSFSLLILEAEINDGFVSGKKIQITSPVALTTPHLVLKCNSPGEGSKQACDLGVLELAANKVHAEGFKTISKENKHYQLTLKDPENTTLQVRYT